MSAILTLALKDLRLLARDKPALFFTVGFPVIFAVFFGTIFAGGGDGGGGGIAVVVVDEDKSEASRKFVDLLEKGPELRVAKRAVGAPEITAEQAAELVRLGKQTAYVRIPPGFGRTGVTMFWNGGKKLEFGVDPSRKAEAGMLEGVLTRYAFQQMSDLFADPGAMRGELAGTRGLLAGEADLDPQRKALMDSMFGSMDSLFADIQSDAPQESSESAPAAGFNPINVERKDITVARAGPTNPYALTFAQALLWGVAGCAASFSMSLVVERTRGTLLRLRLSPLSWGQVLASKALACYFASLLVCGLLMLIAMFVFGVRPTSPAMLMLAVLSIAACFTGIMMVLAVLGRSESAAGAIGWAVILALMMIGGGMVPTFVMPGWMQSMGRLSPVHWGIRAAEGGLWRGFSAGEMLMPCAILLAAGAAGLLLGVRLFKLSETR